MALILNFTPAQQQQVNLLQEQLGLNSPTEAMFKALEMATLKVDPIRANEKLLDMLKQRQQLNKDIERMLV